MADPKITLSEMFVQDDEPIFDVRTSLEFFVYRTRIRLPHYYRRYYHQFVSSRWNSTFFFVGGETNVSNFQFHIFGRRMCVCGRTNETGKCNKIRYVNQHESTNLPIAGERTKEDVIRSNIKYERRNSISLHFFCRWHIDIGFNFSHTDAHTHRQSQCRATRWCFCLETHILRITDRKSIECIPA